MPSKVSSQRTLRTTRSRLPTAQGGIQNFARTSKPGAIATDAKNKPKASPISITASSKKRKLDESEETKSDEGEASSDKATAPTNPLKARKLERPVAASPEKAVRSQRKKSPSPSPAPPSRASSVDSLLPADETPLTSFSSTSTETSNSSPRTTSFDDLLSLHSSFLSALAIHYAHNGQSSSADLGALCQHMEKIWKKRKVVIKDVQRLVHVLGLYAEKDTSADFRVADYGKGKICLEQLDRHADRAGFPMPFDEARLSEIFSQNLERLWQDYADETQEDESPKTDFAESIPLAPIHSSVSTFNPLKKGQLRLQDLKAGVVVVKAERENRAKALDSSTLKKDAKATAGRRMGLLERIKNKESEQAKLPPPPSKDALLRKSATQRIEDVAGVLLQLRPTGSAEMDTSNSAPFRRKPYKLSNVIQNVQDSTRNPISDQEVELCLNIMAQPSVAGDWVSIIAIGKMKSVVLKSGDGVSPQDIAMRAAKQEGI
ncbi:hypothetical protein FQN54_009412 [Arachnomyces sp. PD_36]|nr:hypothetical protein FQN54_009412 [Arachnomyces sp. PD_36]